VIKLAEHASGVTLTEKKEARQKKHKGLSGRSSFELRVEWDKEVVAHATFVPDVTHSAKEWMSKIRSNMRHKVHHTTH
jgi:hypothetical protein